MDDEADLTLAAPEEIAAEDTAVVGASTFQSIGVCDELCKTIVDLGWKQPTAIQVQAIPRALAGHDIIGLAKTGSGKNSCIRNSNFAGEGSDMMLRSPVLPAGRKWRVCGARAGTPGKAN
jgi:hypothetical protein